MRLAALMILILTLSGCASNILVSNCRSIQIEGEESGKWICVKGWSDYWR